MMVSMWGGIGSEESEEERGGEREGEGEGKGEKGGGRGGRGEWGEGKERGGRGRVSLCVSPPQEEVVILTL